MARLQIFLPDDNTISHDLVEQKVSVGRAPDNDLQIEDVSVSSHHAEILFGAGNYTLKDLGSTNGTSINDLEIKEQILKEGDRIRFGHVDALFGEEDHLLTEIDGEGSGTLVEAAIPTASGLSVRPVDFVCSSPVPKTQNTKDPVRMAALAVAAISILVSLAAIVSSLLVIQTPTFPAP